MLQQPTFNEFSLPNMNVHVQKRIFLMGIDHKDDVIILQAII